MAFYIADLVLFYSPKSLSPTLCTFFIFTAVLPQLKSNAFSRLLAHKLEAARAL